MRQLYPVPGRELAVEEVYRDLVLPDPPAGRPYMLLNFVTTLDGQSTLGTGGAKGIGSAADHRLMRRLRVVADALVHGAGTVRADNFPPVVPPDLVAERTARGLAPQPLGVVISASGRLAPDLRYFSARPPVVFTADARRDTLAETLGARAQVFGAGTPPLDLARALAILREQYGARVALCEGGPRLTHDLIAAGLLDEIFLTLAPKLASEREALRLVEGTPFLSAAAPRAELLHVLQHGSELFLRYRLGQ